MQVVTSPLQLSSLVAQGSVVTIGNFDGVHKGHQELLRSTVEKARKMSLPAVALTFEPHPLCVLLGDKAPPLLMELPAKLEHMRILGLDAVFVLPFTRDLATKSPKDFVQEFLVEALHMQHLVIGYDYAFGKGRAGNTALLTSLGKEYGYTVQQLKAVKNDGVIVSSTEVREQLRQGAVALAADLLGYPYFVTGKVVHGMGRGGSMLGFPTANLTTSEHLFLPPEGVYAVRAQLVHEEIQLVSAFTPVKITKAPLMGVASVGTNPTFNDGTLRIEVHLFDFLKDIYGQYVVVSFIDWVRSQQTFDGVDALVAQIKTDISVTKQHLLSL